tara:strand:- start:1506 stop:2012 length:507 start_codon:yes stop_codon:yes gene_type:complete
MSQIKVNSLVPTGGLVTGAFGGIIQTVSETKTDTNSTSSTSFVDTGLSASITPSSTNNKIWIVSSIYWSHTGGPAMVLNLVRNSTNISQPAVTSGAYAGTVSAWVREDSLSSHTITFLDSPTFTLGDTFTYKIQWKSTNGGSIFLNRFALNTSEYHGTSTISLFEVSG